MMKQKLQGLEFKMFPSVGIFINVFSIQYISNSNEESGGDKLIF